MCPASDRSNCSLKSSKMHNLTTSDIANNPCNKSYMKTTDGYDKNSSTWDLLYGIQAKTTST